MNGDSKKARADMNKATAWVDIEAAKQECIAAFEAHPEATWAWCCHHDVEVEPLTEPAINRITFIARVKHISQLVARFTNFRPVLSSLPEGLLKAQEDFDKAQADWDKATDRLQQSKTDWDKARADWREARADWREARADAWADWREARADWREALADLEESTGRLGQSAYQLEQSIGRYGTELRFLHDSDVSGNTWNGHSIF